MIVLAIVVCEVAFWAFLAAGLAARYGLRRRRLGAILLLGSPVADLALLVLTAIDLHQGATPSQTHALAAIYLGVSLAFGPRIIAWADGRVADRVAGAPPRQPAPSDSARKDHEWRQFGRASLAWAISGGVLLALSLVAGDSPRAATLLATIPVTTAALVIWFVTGPVPAMVAEQRASRSTPTTDKEHTMSTSTDPTTDRRWAPWWFYLSVILGANVVRQLLMPVGTIPEWGVVLVAVSVSAMLFALITALYRVARS